jgi:hypothetical protein
MTQQEALALYKQVHQEWAEAQNEYAERTTHDAHGWSQTDIEEQGKLCQGLMHESAAAWALYRTLGGQ